MSAPKQYWDQQWYVEWLQSMSQNERDAFEAGLQQEMPVFQQSSCSKSFQQELEADPSNCMKPSTSAPDSSSVATIDPEQVQNLRERFERVTVGTEEHTKLELEFAQLCKSVGTPRLSKDKAGCRLVQKALDKASPQAQETICSQLSEKPGPLELSKHVHANFVMQELIVLANQTQAKRFLDALEDDGLRVLIFHRFGCRVVINLLEFPDVADRIADVCIADMMNNAKHSYGHHVVQKLQKVSAKFREALLEQFLSEPKSFLELIKMRNASYVGEEAFRKASKEQKEELIKIVLKGDKGDKEDDTGDKGGVKALLPDGFAKFVIKVMLDHSEVGSQAARQLAEEVKRYADPQTDSNQVFKAAKKVLEGSAEPSGDSKACNSNGKSKEIEGLTRC